MSPSLPLTVEGVKPWPVAIGFFHPSGGNAKMLPMPNRAKMLTVLLLPMMLALSACSTRQGYEGGQAWQRNECIKVVDSDERQRCVDATRLRYEDYRDLPLEPTGTAQ
jgi:hypothetical protein